jgi:hypothetical protein
MSIPDYAGIFWLKEREKIKIWKQNWSSAISPPASGCMKYDHVGSVSNWS